MGFVVKTPAGWYPDAFAPGFLRYWDGTQWTSHTAPYAQSQAVPANQAPYQPPDANTHESNVATKVSFFGAKKRAEDLQREVDQLRSQIVRLGALEAVELEQETKRLVAEVDKLRDVREGLEEEIQCAREQLVETQGLVEFQDVGLYQYRHPAESSVALRNELDKTRAQIKDTVRTKTAILASTSFTFNNSAAQGRKFVSEMSRIMLRAYNAEAENCVKTVKAGNLPAAQARLRKAMDQIAQQGRMIDLRVAEQYHWLRLRELELAADFHMRVQAEKEAERERRAELAEQRKAEQELRRERERLEKELAHYSNAIAMLEKNDDYDGVARLRVKLADVVRAIENVDYRQANIRAGFVYVISNIGAFGANMIKIGMTRRLEPMDRVRELGDASVPFRFDVHALFFADDAVLVESQLHQAFADKRVNRVNLRREFFYATPGEVLDVLKDTVGEVVEYNPSPEAEEYRISQGAPDTSL